jgi:hypothetical protein
MSCCGQRRAALVTRAPAPAVAAPAAVARPLVAPNATPARGGVALRYRGLGPFTARGARTGRLYACGGAGALIQVDGGDVEALLRTRRFQRA